MRHAPRTALAIVALTSSATAQTSDKALAETLFQEGRDLLAAGNTAAACAKFDASLRLERKIGALLNLAACHETEGKTASAWAEFTEARTLAERTNQPERVTFADDHLKALEPRLARIIVRSATRQGVSVRIDGVPVEHAALDVSFPVDPGRHAITAEMPGKVAWNAELSIAAGPSSDTVEIPELVDEPAPPRAVAAPAPSGARRTAAWITLGAGVLATGVGAFYGLRAFGLKSDASSECDGAACSQRGLDLYGDVRTSATVSTIAFSAGIATVAISLILFMTSGGDAPAAPRTAGVAR